MDSVEKWRQAVGIESFFLAGHSFGGYIGTQYTLVHQNRVKKLLLLSPVGFTRAGDKERMNDIKKKLGCFTGLIIPIFTRIMKSKITPNSLCRNNPRLAKFFVKRFIHKRFGMKDPEATLLRDYMVKMLSLPEGSEQAIHHILKPPVGAACYALEDDIAEKIKIAVDCFFGDTDYMDQTGANRLAKSGRKHDFIIKIIPKAAHQLTMQNPKKLSEEITISAFKEVFHENAKTLI